ncbi:acetyl-CoA acetyltransferase [soil metagenome]
MTTPVLVGWHALNRRDADVGDALEAADLMTIAAKAAIPGHLRGAVDWIGATEGLTRYADPARLVGDRLGAHTAHTVLAKIGVMQQSLIAGACDALQRGKSQLALVIGGEAHYRHVRTAAAGRPVEITAQPDGTTPDETWSSDDFDQNMAHPAEAAAGLRATPGYYALVDSQWRSALGRTPAAQRAAIGTLYQRFSEIAAQNPRSVRAKPLTAGQIVTPAAANPMIAFPYTKMMTTTWTVDQSCALLFTTTEHAEALGIPSHLWRYPVIATESNHVVPVAARTRLSQPASIRIMADTITRHTGVDTADIEAIDLYSAFPAPVMIGAHGLGVPPERDLTLTGGMSFAGGPLNSYLFHAVAAAANRLSDGSARALLSCVSGYYSKQGLLMLSAQPPGRQFEVVDVTAEVARAEPAVPIDGEPTGPGRVIAYTVLYEEDRPERAVVIVDLDTGMRAVARNHDSAVLHAATTEDLIGRTVLVDRELFELARG